MTPLTLEDRLARLAGLLAAALFDAMRGTMPGMTTREAADALMNTPIEEDVLAAGKELAAVMLGDVNAGKWPPVVLFQEGGAA